MQRSFLQSLFRRDPSSDLPDAACRHLNPLIVVIEEPVHTADRGGGGTGALCDLLVGLLIQKADAHIEALGKGEQFVDGADVLEEREAFFLILQFENSVKKLFDHFGMYTLFHDNSFLKRKMLLSIL